VIVGYFLCLKQIKEIPEEYLQRLGVKPYYLLIYPITLIITFLPSSFLHVFITLAHTKTPPVWLLLLRSVVTHSVGLWNAIMYILFRKLYQVPKKYELSEEQIDEYQQYSSHSSEEEEEL